MHKAGRQMEGLIFEKSEYLSTMRITCISIFPKFFRKEEEVLWTILQSFMLPA